MRHDLVGRRGEERKTIRRYPHGRDSEAGATEIATHERGQDFPGPGGLAEAHGDPMLEHERSDRTGGHREKTVRETAWALAQYPIHQDDVGDPQVVTRFEFGQFPARIR